MSLIEHIDELNPAGNSLEIINGNFSLLNIRACNIDATEKKLTPFFNSIHELSSSLNQIYTYIDSMSANLRDVSNLVYNVQGHWLSPITLTYFKPFDVVASFEDIESWLNSTFGLTTFSQNQILKISYLVRNYNPESLDNVESQNTQSDETLNSIAASLGFSTTDIFDYINYRNHVNSIISSINNIFRATNNQTYIVSNHTQLRNLLNSFLITSTSFYSTALPINLTAKQVKLIYSLLFQYTFLEDRYIFLLDKGADDISALVLDSFNRFDVYGTYFGHFCFTLVNDKWTYSPDCNLNFCVNQYCDDCYDYLDPNELYRRDNCINPRFSLIPCDGASFATLAPLHKYVDQFIDIYSNGETIKVQVLPFNGDNDFIYLPQSQFTVLGLSMSQFCGGIIPCGETFNFSGEIGTHTFELFVGSTDGIVQFNFDTYDIPDRFRVYYNGIEMADTGFRGGSGFDQDLADLGFPPVVGPPAGSVSFYKSGLNPIITIIVDAPLVGTAFYFDVPCLCDAVPTLLNICGGVSAVNATDAMPTNFSYIPSECTTMALTTIHNGQLAYRWVQPQ